MSGKVRTKLRLYNPSPYTAPRLGERLHLDKAVLTINGERYFLWRVVDQDGFVLKVLVQKRRHTKAARRLIRKLLSGQSAAFRVMVTDKLRSYGAANPEIGLTVAIKPA